LSRSTGKDVLASAGVIGEPTRTAGVGEGATVGDGVGVGNAGVGVAGELLPQAIVNAAMNVRAAAAASFTFVVEMLTKSPTSRNAAGYGSARGL
jgi:hypothetical protein